MFAYEVDINLPLEPLTLLERSIEACTGRNALRPLDFSHPQHLGGFCIMDNRLEDLGKEISARARELVGQDGDNQAYLDAVEMLAIEVLDSRYMAFEEGELEQYLSQFLDELRLKLGLDNL